MKFTFDEWQVIRILLQEKRNECNYRMKKLYQVDKDIEKKWEYYSDTGEYVHDINTLERGTDTDEDYISEYDTFHHIHTTANDILKKIYFHEFE